MREDRAKLSLLSEQAGTLVPVANPISLRAMLPGSLLRRCPKCTTSALRFHCGGAKTALVSRYDCDTSVLRLYCDYGTAELLLSCYYELLDTYSYKYEYSYRHQDQCE